MSTSATHFHPELAKLRELVEGEGGRLRVLVGTPSVEQEPLFYAGLRRPPATTLIEAALTFLAAPCYQRIVIFSGAGNHLPECSLAPGKTLGLLPCVWVFRGTGKVAKTDPPAPRLDSEEIDPARLRRFRPLDRVLVNLQGKWRERVDQILELIEQECGFHWRDDSHQPRGGEKAPRSLLLLDDALLRLTTTETAESRTSLLQPSAELNADQRRGRIEKRFKSIPSLLRQSQVVDLVVLAHHPLTLDGLRQGSLLRDQVLAIQHDFPKHLLAQLPALQWQDVFAVPMPRSDSSEPHGPFFKNASRGMKLYDVLRSIPAEKPTAKVRPSQNPAWIEREFWARIEVPAIERRLNRDVIGQRHVISAILEGLLEFQETCQYALKAGESLQPGPGRPVPPEFLFTGESGMGKTYIAKLLAEELFGAQFAEVIKLTEKSATDELFGSRPGYAGYDDTKLFLAYCQRTKGMGLVVFDELDKLRRDSQQELSQAASPFLGVLEERSLVPNNPNFANANNRSWFPNTVFIFTANAAEDGNRPGYVPIESFGAPLLRRFKNRVVQFGALESDQIPRAVDFFLKQYLRDLLAEMFRNNDRVAIASDLVPRLVREYDDATRSRPQSRSFAVLKDGFLQTRLPRRKLKQKFHKDNLSLDIEDLSPEPWNAV